MKIIIVDLECTCWETASDGVGKTMEIIEVGLAMYDGDNQMVTREPVCLIKPVYSTVSPFCTKLTSLTQGMLLSMPTWDQVYKGLYQEYAHYIWASFGDFDRSMLERQAKLFEVPVPFSHQHINVKALASAKLNKRIKGMTHALRELNIPLIGTHHRGSDDAYNIGKILKELL